MVNCWIIAINDHSIYQEFISLFKCYIKLLIRFVHINWVIVSNQGTQVLALDMKVMWGLFIAITNQTKFKKKNTLNGF